MTERIRLTEDNRKWWTLAAMCFALFMIMLDNTVVNVALPAISDDLAAGLGDHVARGRRRGRRDRGRRADGGAKAMKRVLLLVLLVVAGCGGSSRSQLSSGWGTPMPASPPTSSTVPPLAG